jgi:hypothetical protein
MLAGLLTLVEQQCDSLTGNIGILRAVSEENIALFLSNAFFGSKQRTCYICKLKIAKNIEAIN